MKNRVLMVIMI